MTLLSLPIVILLSVFASTSNRGRMQLPSHAYTAAGTDTAAPPLTGNPFMSRANAGVAYDHLCVRGRAPSTPFRAKGLTFVPWAHHEHRFVVATRPVHCITALLFSLVNVKALFW